MAGAVIVKYSTGRTAPLRKQGSRVTMDDVRYPGLLLSQESGRAANWSKADA